MVTKGDQIKSEGAEMAVIKESEIRAVIIGSVL